MVEAKIATEENKAHADAMSHVITEEEYKKLGKSLFTFDLLCEVADHMANKKPFEFNMDESVFGDRETKEEEI